MRSFRILNSNPPYAVAASVEPLDQAKPAANFASFFECSDFDVLPDDLEGSIRAVGIDTEKSVALFVLHLLAGLRVKSIKGKRDPDLEADPTIGRQRLPVRVIY